MTDSRPRVALNGKKINPEQLTDEVGCGLCFDEQEVVAAEGAKVTQTKLSNAVKAHTPDPNYGKSPEQVELETIQAKKKPASADLLRATELLLHGCHLEPKGR